MIPPVEKIKILLLENIHPVARERLEDQGFFVETKNYSPDEAEFSELVRKFHVIGIRSKSRVTKKILESATDLHALGAFCIGTNQIDLAASNQHGIPVFNAPYSNTRSVAEMVIAEMIVLSRQLGDRNRSAHEGGWLKSTEGSREIRGKTLGIVGYGHIGSQVSILAEAVGLKVVFYDILKKLPLGNARPCLHLRELLNQSDFVTLHVPETDQTKNMISRDELTAMKKGSHLINASRGNVVVIQDLVDALKQKHLGGAAIDVFPQEPSSNQEKFLSPLQGLPNVFLTPHIGGSTEEAQYAIGIEVAESLCRFLKLGSTSGAVNFPQIDVPASVGTHRIINVHRNEPGVLGEINGIVSGFGANIQGQFLSTDSQVGYLIMDVEKAEAELLSKKIGQLSRSVKTRIVY